MNRLYIICLCLLMANAAKAQWGGSCNGGTGNVIDNNTNFNCHQYVKGALVSGVVDLSDGELTNPYFNWSTLSNSSIESSQDFIRVGNYTKAKAISVIGSDHSMIILNNTFYGGTYGTFASTPGLGSKLYTHGHVGFTTNKCTYKMYATTDGFSITGPSGTIQEGNTATFSLAHSSNLMTEVEKVHWSVNTQYLEITSYTSTSVTVKGKCGASVSGLKSAYIRGDIETFAMTGTYGDPNADLRPRVSINRNVNCVNSGPNCTGTLNNGPLYTFNSITAGQQNTIVMAEGTYNWTKTSGTTSSWATNGSNYDLKFTVPSGCINVTATRSGCSLTFTFCAFNFGPNANPNNFNNSGGDSNGVQYTILDLGTGKVVRSGCVDLVDKMELAEGLPIGNYVLNAGGKRQKISVTRQE